jgi:AraC-like DNA-binding protein
MAIIIKVIHAQPLENIFVDNYTYYRGTGDDQICLLPQGIFQLVIPLQGKVYHKPYFGDNWYQVKEPFLGGPYRKSHQLKVNGTLLVVALKPNKAYSLLPAPAFSYKEQNFSLSSLWGNDAQLFVNTLSQATSPNESNCVDDFLCSRSFSKPESRITSVIEEIETIPIAFSIKEWIDKSGFSPSHFRKLFYESMGLAPKQFLKIRRINQIVKFLQNQLHHTSLTEVSYQFGYFDQSHFNKDFKDITGFSPKRTFESILCH